MSRVNFGLSLPLILASITTKKKTKKKNDDDVKSKEEIVRLFRWLYNFFLI